MKPRHVVQMLAPLAVAGAFFALYAWNPGSPDPVSFPSGPGFTTDPASFDGRWDLVDAIEDGSFAERVGLDDTLVLAKPLPDPIQVEFVSGTAVPASARAMLEAFAGRLEDRPDVALRVVGCSDRSGPERVNLRISEQRAESVAAELRDLGVDDARFATVMGRGENCETPERAVNVVPTRADEIARAS